MHFLEEEAPGTAFCVRHKEIVMNFKKWTIMGLSMAIAATVGLSSSDAEARTMRSGYGIERQANQLARIRSAIRGGALTKRESRALFREQRRINRLRHKFMRDGRFTRFERRRMRRMLKRADRNIFRLSRNGYFHHRQRYWEPERKRMGFKNFRRPYSLI